MIFSSSNPYFHFRFFPFPTTLYHEGEKGKKEKEKGLDGAMITIDSTMGGGDKVVVVVVFIGEGEEGEKGKKEKGKKVMM